MYEQKNETYHGYIQVPGRGCTRGSPPRHVVVLLWHVLPRRFVALHYSLCYNQDVIKSQKNECMTLKPFRTWYDRSRLSGNGTLQ